MPTIAARLFLVISAPRNNICDGSPFKAWEGKGHGTKTPITVCLDRLALMTSSVKESETQAMMRNQPLSPPIEGDTGICSVISRHRLKPEAARIEYSKSQTMSSRRFPQREQDLPHGPRTGLSPRHDPLNLAQHCMHNSIIIITIVDTNTVTIIPRRPSFPSPEPTAT